MKTKFQKATMWLLRGLFVSAMTVYSLQAEAGTTSVRSNCQKLLKAAIAAKSSAELLNRLDELDQTLWSLHDVRPEELANIRRRFENVLDQALEDHMDEAQGVAEEILRELAYTETDADAEDASSTILDMMELPNSVADLSPDQAYATRYFYMRSVRFTPEALKEMAQLDSLTSERLLRSLQKGVVPPRSGSGIVRCTDVHKNFVEVKIIGKGVARLLGCLEGGELKIKTVYHKRNEGSGGALQAYANLCAD